mgnify:FL=1
MNFSCQKNFNVSLSEEELFTIIYSYIKEIKSTAANLASIDNMLQPTDEQIKKISKLYNELGNYISRILELQPKYAKGGIIK